MSRWRRRSRRCSAPSSAATRHRGRCLDEEFGTVCVKFSAYFPYTGAADPQRQRVCQPAARVDFISADRRRRNMTIRHSLSLDSLM
jgi:hypothetical protein